MSASQPRPLAGSEGALSVFWSPHSRSVAFFAGGKLKRQEIGGGTPVVLCSAREAIGQSGTWGRDGVVLFSSVAGDAIFRTSTAGEAEAILRPDPSRGESRLTAPMFLPDGRRFLYLSRATDGAIRLMLREPERRRHARSARWVPTSSTSSRDICCSSGRERCSASASIRSRARSVASRYSIADGVTSFFSTGVAQFTASLSGTVVFRSGDNRVACRVD